jgi:hypothetical protein
MQQTIVNSESEGEARYYGSERSGENASHRDDAISERLDASFLAYSSNSVSEAEVTTSAAHVALDPPPPEIRKRALPSVRVRPLRVPRMHILLIAVGTR